MIKKCCRLVTFGSPIFLRVKYWLKPSKSDTKVRFHGMREAFCHMPKTGNEKNAGTSLPSSLGESFQSASSSSCGS